MKPPGFAATENGYTLIETVVALTIAALALSVLLHSVGGNAQRSGLSRQYTVATSFGESMLARVGRDIALEPGTRNGKFDDIYYWSRIIRPVVAEEPTESTMPVTRYEIIVSVRWRSGNRPHDLSIRTLRLKVEQNHAPT